MKKLLAILFVVSMLFGIRSGEPEKMSGQEEGRYTGNALFYGGYSIVINDEELLSKPVPEIIDLIEDVFKQAQYCTL